MRTSSSQGLLFVLSAVLTLALASSAVMAQQIGYKLKDRVPLGQSPILYVTPNEDMDRLQINLTRSDGKLQKLVKKKVPTGETLEIPIKQGEGSFTYKAEIIMLAATGIQTTAEIDFEAVVAKPLKLKLLQQQTDLDQRVVAVKINTPVQKADIIVYGEDGVLETLEQNLTGLKAGAVAKLTWSTQTEAKRVEVKIHDRLGFWSGFELLRIVVDIPHDEVNFDTGEATFADAEARKLDSTLTQIYEELDKYKEYSTQLTINLYIAGYTDTVGDRGANQSLSQSRARAIAAYFRKKGLPINIFYQGFGEDALAVKTGDNVDEARNRRALYVLSNFPPPVSYHLPRKAWKALK